MKTDRNCSPITKVYNDKKVFLVTFKDGTSKEITGKSFKEAFETLMPFNYENMAKIRYWNIKKEV